VLEEIMPGDEGKDRNLEEGKRGESRRVELSESDLDADYETKRSRAMRHLAELLESGDLPGKAIAEIRRRFERTTDTTGMAETVESAKRRHKAAPQDSGRSVNLAESFRRLGMSEAEAAEAGRMAPGTEEDFQRALEGFHIIGEANGTIPLNERWGGSGVLIQDEPPKPDAQAEGKGKDKSVDLVESGKRMGLSEEEAKIFGAGR